MYIGLGTILLAFFCWIVGNSIAEGAANRRRMRELERMKQRVERGLE